MGERAYAGATCPGGSSEACPGAEAVPEAYAEASRLETAGGQGAGVKVKRIQELK